MTVCIAARSEGCLVGVSDRMLTLGDIQFERPATPTISPVSNSIAIMQSGNAAFNTEILHEVASIVADRIRAFPTEWCLVKDVTDLWVQNFNAAKRKRAEATLLAPLGLTIGNYRREVHKFSESVAEQLIRDIIEFTVPQTSVIITGIDTCGAHIYVVDDGNVSCNDIVGFAAVGIGQRHAESQFMLARHAWNSPLVDTALLAYIAKRRSEVAPGVGKATDMFSAGPGLGTLRPLTEEAIENFERIYRKLWGKEEAARDEARREANDLVIEASVKAAEQVKG